MRHSFPMRHPLRLVIPQTDKAVGIFPRPRRASPLFPEHGKCATNHHYVKFSLNL